MSEYQVAVNHDNEAGLAEVTPQPRNPADFQYIEVLDAADGSVIPQGKPYVELYFSVLLYEEYTSVLTQFGLSETTFNANVTVKLHENGGTWGNYNGIASHRPGKRRSSAGWWEDFVITVSRLTAI